MATQIKVSHDWYGCETGCCGHRVTRTDDDGNEDEKWFFEHPRVGGDADDFARKLVSMAWPDLEEFDLDVESVSDD